MYNATSKVRTAAICAIKKDAIPTAFKNQELKELQRQRTSIQAISKLTGWDRKRIRKYM